MINACAGSYTALSLDKSILKDITKAQTLIKVFLVVCCMRLAVLKQKNCCVLQVVSELLSQHVLQNYDKFVAGIDEVGLVEQDLLSACATVKSARANLRASSTEISTNIKVCSNTFFVMLFLRMLSSLCLVHFLLICAATCPILRSTDCMKMWYQHLPVLMLLVWALGTTEIRYLRNEV